MLRDSKKRHKYSKRETVNTIKNGSIEGQLERIERRKK